MFLELTNLYNKIKEYLFPKLKGEKLECLTCGVKTVYPEVGLKDLTDDEYYKHWANLFELARKAENI